MKTTKDDIYIETLKFGRARLGKPIKYSALTDHLKSVGFKMAKSGDDNHAENVFHEYAVRMVFYEYFNNPETPSGNRLREAPSNNHSYFFQPAGYFNLMEHVELKEARRSSLVATRFAAWALVLSIVTGLTSIYFSSQQLNTPVTTEPTQIEMLTDHKNQDNNGASVEREKPDKEVTTVNTDS